MIKRIGISSLIMFLFYFSTVAQEAVIDKVIAQVGGELVLLSDLEKQFAYLNESQGGFLGAEAKCGVLESLLAQRLMVHQAKVDSVYVGDDEVEAQLSFRIESILSQMNNDEAFFEATYNQTVDQVKEWMREDLRAQLLAERMQGTILEEVDITPVEVLEFFAKIPKDSLPYFNSEVEVAEISLKPIVNAGEKNTAKQRLVEYRKRIVEGGEDFAELASTYSDDFGSARLGGDLGMQKRGTFVPEFEAAAYSLDVGEISEVIETVYGFHIIQLNERRGNIINARHILVKPKVTSIDIEATKSLLDSVKTLVEVDSINFNLAVKKYGDDDVESHANSGRITNPINRSTFFETKDLPPDIYFATEGMEVGEISNVLEYTNPLGETLYRVIQLQSRSKPHQANLKEDYTRIQNYAIESKKAEYFNTYILDKVDNTYVKIESQYLSCPNLDIWTEGR